MTHATTITAVKRRVARAAQLVAAAVVLGVALSAPAQAAAPGWEILAATGPTNLKPFSSERQTVTGPFFGTFTLTFGADTTAAIASNAPATGPGSVEEALNALPSISAGGGSVSVSLFNSPAFGGYVYVVTFDGGPLAGTDFELMTTAGFGASVVPTPSGTIAIYPRNVGLASTSGAYTVEVDLPPGVTTAATPDGEFAYLGWSCGPAGAGQSSFSCTNSSVARGGDGAPTIFAPVVTTTATPGTLTADLSITGGGAASAGSAQMPITLSDAPAEAGVQAYFAGAYDENGNPETRAGAHPASAITGFLLNTVLSPSGRVVAPAGGLRDVILDPPAGFIANPMVAPRCPREDSTCQNDAIVGAVSPALNTFGGGGGTAGFGLFNVLPPSGSAAQFTFQAASAKVATVGRLRPNDYGVRGISPNLPGDYKPFGAFANLWGEPGAPARDSTRCLNGRCPLPNPGSVDEAFVTNPTECSGNTLATIINTTSWQTPEAFSTRSYDSPAITDCDDVPFDPTVDIAATSATADAPSGLGFDVSLPQDGLLDPDGIATSHLRDVVVDLPDGMSVNPSGATGLEGCSDAQVAPGTDSVPQCPDGSKIGTVEATSPLADHPVGGTMYLGTPKSTDPTSGEMFRLWVVARDDELGVLIKIPGSAIADRQTGKLTATFENNPRLPFDHLSVDVKGGDRGVLAMPQTCEARQATSGLSPWSGTSPVSLDSPIATNAACGFGFSPSLKAGVSNTAARGSGDFSFELSRPQGDQWVDGLTAHLPAGLVASLKGVPLCSNVQANIGACPEGSRIGTVDASAGSGSPFVLEQKGAAYLTEGYKGAPYGLAVKVRAIAGPFRGQFELDPIIVRQKVEVDRSTAEVSVVSDPLPTVWHGVPLRMRRVLVKVDRPGFMLNPSDCSTKQIGADIHSPQGTTVQTAERFRVGSCANLPFRPKLTLGLTGKRQVTTGKHPGIKAQVTQAGVSEAGVKKVVVQLPKSLALDPDNAQALCEFADGTRPDLDNHCPKGSIVGRARAVTPLLDKPLAGNVYFVKNVRKDPKTGNLIRTLPMIIVALRGEIAVNLRGESSTTKAGNLVNTFASVPDAPISQFNLNINGGNNGILAVTRTRRAKINLCAGRHIAETDIDGQNGRTHDTNIRMKTPCTKKQTKAAKRAAAKAKRG